MMTGMRRESVAAAATGRISKAMQRMMPTSWERITTVTAIINCSASCTQVVEIPLKVSISLWKARATKR